MPTAEALVELVEAVACRRDKQAFAILYRSYAPRLKTWLMRRGLGEGPAEDLVQETMVAVWRKASYYRPERAGVTTWIFRIARNHSIDYLRRASSAPSSNESQEEPIETMATGEAFVMGVEREHLMRLALEKLSPEQSRTIRLSFFEDKPHREIAEELGLPLGTVKSRIRMALTRLRLLLQDEQ